MDKAAFERKKNFPIFFFFFIIFIEKLDFDLKPITHPTLIHHGKTVYTFINYFYIKITQKWILNMDR